MRPHVGEQIGLRLPEMAGSMDRLKGWVKWFDSRRGFGFITPEGGGQDIFVHQSSIASVGFRSLTAGETVEFVVSVNDDGRSSAVSVTGFGDACIPVGNMERDCNYGIPCYGFLATQPTGLWNPLKLESLPPLPAKVETLVGQVSEEQSEVISEDSEPKSGAEWRNWADLPGDILSIIFKKIAAAEILLSAQFVCKPWRQLSLEPSLWRCIDLRMYKSLDNMVSLAMMAVDRSEGFVEELFMESFPTDDLMHYIAERATRLRGLHLISAFINEEAFVQTLIKLPLLEELELSLCSCFSYKIVERIGETCPQLKSFGLNGRAPTSFQFYRRSESRRNTAALAIAKHFKQLRRLQLFANCLTSIGLSAILGNCPDLEYLDIRFCFNVSSLDESLKNKCARIKDLRLPNDSTSDYEYGVGELQTDDSYINPHLYVTYYDFGYSDDDYSYFDFYEIYDLSDFDSELF